MQWNRVLPYDPNVGSPGENLPTNRPSLVQQLETEVEFEANRERLLTENEIKDEIKEEPPSFHEQQNQENTPEEN